MRSHTEIAQAITDQYLRRPRPIKKMFGLNPTSSQVAVYSQLSKAHNNAMRKLRAELKLAIESLLYKVKS